jgi:uncharacterized membrane protein (UPF0127 family)
MIFVSRFTHTGGQMKRLVAILSGGFAALALLVAYGCGGTAATPTPLSGQALPEATTLSLTASTAPTAPAGAGPTWVPPTALVGTPIPGAEATLTVAPLLPKGTLTITNSLGEKVVMSVEIAATEQARELGLMFRDSMPPDTGMLFDFKGETTGGFWMQNTILPLSIAFIQQDGSIVSIADMEPLNTDTVNAAGPYYYAIEANQGFYRAHNINPDDKVSLPVDTSLVVPGMPSVGK